MITRLRQQLAGEQSWFFIIVAIAFTPLVQGLLTTTFDGYVTYGQSVIRVLSVVTILTELFVVVVAIKLGVWHFMASAAPPRAKILLALFCTSAMISVFSSENMLAFSLFITLRFFLQLAALFSLVHIMAVSPAFDTTRYFRIIASGLLLYVAYIVLVIATIDDPATFYWPGGLPSATNIRHIGNYVAILLLAAIGISLIANDATRWFALVLVFIATAFLAWTGSRAAFFGLIIALPVALYAIRRTVSATRVTLSISTLAAAVVFSTALPVPDSSFGVMRMITASDTRQNGDISSARTVVWKHTIAEIEEAPLAGHGAGRFLGNMDAKYRLDLDNPHNVILQFAYDWGIIGAALAFALLATGSFQLVRLPLISPLATFCAVSGLILMLSIGMLEGMFYHPLKMLLVSALVAPAFALARQRQVQSTTFC